eukprot:2408086-Ditylum_brightwellii.AAC.1
MAHSAASASGSGTHSNGTGGTTQQSKNYFTNKEQNGKNTSTFKVHGNISHSPPYPHRSTQ